MNRNPKGKPQPPPDDDDDNMDLHGNQEDDGDDFDFDNGKRGFGNDGKSKKVENLPFDEAVEVSEGEPSDDEDEPQPKKKGGAPATVQEKVPKNTGKPIPVHAQGQDDDDEFSGGGAGAREVAGAYNPADYANLNVTGEVKELFKYIERYKPLNIELDQKLKVFIPDYMPAVGEVDAFLKFPRPDNQPETLGLISLDEPTLNQSKKSKLDLEFKEFLKKVKGDSNKVVHSIENAEKNPKEINAWINDVQEVHKKKQPPSVSYTRPMPEIDHLMQVWPPEFEDALASLRLPSEEIDISLEHYCKLACALLDIPVHPTTNNKNVVESLHVFFTLYSEFKANQHFRQMGQTAEVMNNPSTPTGYNTQTMKF